MIKRFLLNIQKKVSNLIYLPGYDLAYGPVLTYFPKTKENCCFISPFQRFPKEKTKWFEKVHRIFLTEIKIPCSLALNILPALHFRRWRKNTLKSSAHTHWMDSIVIYQLSQPFVCGATEDFRSCRKNIYVFRFWLMAHEEGK